MTVLRPYQQEAIDAVKAYWKGGGGNPLVEMATGTGKSLVIAELAKDLVLAYPKIRVLIVTHVRELVSQNFKAMLKLWPDAPAGVYSASLGRRDAHHRITFASIQSVYNKAAALGIRHLILIDEAHLVPLKGEGMYRRLIDDLRADFPKVRVAGFTATPWRMDSGRLDAGPRRLFNEIVYTYGVGQAIADGWLAPLMSRASAGEIDVSGVQRRGGEFVPSSLQQAAATVTAQAVREIAAFGESRHSWLVFCAGVDHAAQARDALRAEGVSCETITGQTPSGERASLVKRFKDGHLRCLTNANVLTTGFDAPNVDLIAMLRPTLSTALYVQMAGRGTRLAQGKENCLVLDFAGNIRRHGPIDAVSIALKGGGGEGRVSVDSVRAKECPSCFELVSLQARECKACGHKWQQTVNPDHDAQAESRAGILSSENVPPERLPVTRWNFSRHTKYGSPDSVKVTYFAGISVFREWLAFEHGHGATWRAAQWWSLHRGRTPFPKTVSEALSRTDELVMPQTLSVKPRGKFHDIVSRTFMKEPAHG